MTASEDEPPIREFADRGVLWLLESPQNLADLIRMLSAELAAQLDFSRAERRNRSFVPPNLHKQEADLLYQVPFLDPNRPGREVLIYLLAEHQSEPEEDMGLRLLSYLAHIWGIEKRAWERKRQPRGPLRIHPVVPILLYTGTRRWNQVPSVADLMDLPELCIPFQPTHRTLFLNLHDTPAATLEGSVVGWALRTLQSVEGSHEQLSEVLAAAVRYLESLPEEAQAEWRRAMQYLLLLIQHKREPVEHIGLRDVVIASATRKHQEEVKSMAMTAAQAFEEKGRIEERESIVLRLLQKRFGATPAALQDRIHRLSPSLLAELALAVIDFTDLAEAQDWVITRS